MTNSSNAPTPNQDNNGWDWFGI